MSSNRNGFTLEIPLAEPKVGAVNLASVQLTLFPKQQSSLPDDYLQKLTKEIQFLWSYVPLDSESGFAELVLNYVFSEFRIPTPRAYPFKKVLLHTATRTYAMAPFRFHLKVETTPFGFVDPLYVVPKFGVYRLRIGAGKTIPKHLHRVMKETELALSEGLLLDGAALALGAVKNWELGVAHGYVNPTGVELGVLCIDEPAFDAKDEILV